MDAAYSLYNSALRSRYNEYDHMEDLRFKSFRFVRDNTTNINVQVVDSYTALHGLACGFLSCPAGTLAWKLPEY